MNYLTMSLRCFIKGAFLKLSINSALSFDLKLEQKMAVNCSVETEGCFRSDADRFW